MILEDDLQNIFSRGKPWPPADELKRIAIYDANLKLWNRRHDEVYDILRNLYADREKDYNKVLFLINFHRQLSTLWADLLFSEKPQILAQDQQAQTYLDSLVDRLSLWSKCYAIRIDMSRYGAGIAKIYAIEGEPASLQVISPRNWYPVIGGDGEVSQHIIAWESRPNVLNVEMHNSGTINSFKLQLANGYIRSDPYDVREVSTGYDRPLVFPILNAITSDDLYGTDDYQDIDPIIKRLEVTFTRIGRILDAHSEPAFAVPEDALGPRDPVTGELTYNAKRRIFPIGESDKLPQYITWDGQLSAAFSLIDKAMTQLFTISETCRCAFEPDTLGSTISGKALRMLMMRPLKKGERAKLQFDPALKQILKAISILDVANGVPGAVLLDGLRIIWKDGLPDDDYEEAQIASMKRAAGWSAKQILLEAGYSEDDADRIVQEASEGI
jgi:Phage portal protein, SPP1 Gp6-like.